MDIMRLTDITTEPLIATILLVFTTIALLLWYSSWKQSYWKKIGIPYVKPLPIFGSHLEKFRTFPHHIELDRFEKLGRIYGHYEGNRALLSVAEPELIRVVLANKFQAIHARRKVETGNKFIDTMLSCLRGEDWKRVRSIMAACFSTSNTKRMLSIFDECSKTLVKNVRETSERGEIIDAKKIFSAYTMDIIASTAFSYKIDSHSYPNDKFVSTAREIFSRKVTWRILIFVLCTPIMKLFNMSVLPPKAIKFFTDRVLQTVEERRRTGQTRNDYLQLLIDAAKDINEHRKLDLNEKDELSDNYGKVDYGQTFENITSNKSMSDEEIVSQCIIFFFAGYVTTASALSFLSYELALNPDIQEKVIQDVDEALKANGGQMTYEAIQSMKYLDNVIAETLRLYPPFVRLERLSDGDYVLGDTGLTIPKGMIVSIPIYTLHRDPKLFPDPEKFNPDRFSPEGRDKQVPYSYLPFGAGPRSCVAMRFALMEVKVCIAHVLSNFNIKKCPTTKVPVEYDHDMGFLQPKNVPLFLEIRKKN